MKLYGSVALTLQHKGSEVHSISPDSTVFEALEKMAEQDIGALVVMKGTDLVGIFSERDYARQVILGAVLAGTKVHEVVSSPVRTVSSKTTVDECMRLMTTGRCRHMPVVDEGKARRRGVDRRPRQPHHYGARLRSISSRTTSPAKPPA